MASWWHNSPGYIPPISAQQLLLYVSAATVLLQKGHVSLGQFTRIAKYIADYCTCVM